LEGLDGFTRDGLSIHSEDDEEEGENDLADYGEDAESELQQILGRLDEATRKKYENGTMTEEEMRKHGLLPDYGDEDGEFDYGDEENEDDAADEDEDD